MKKTHVTLVLLSFLTLFIAFTSCNFDDKTVTNETSISTTVSVTTLSDDILLNYAVKNYGTPNMEVVFDNYYRYPIKDVIYLEDLLTSNYEREAKFCNSTIYESLNTTEMIYLKTDKFIDFYKETDSGGTYHKILTYRNDRQEIDT